MRNILSTYKGELRKNHVVPALMYISLVFAIGVTAFVVLLGLDGSKVNYFNSYFISIGLTTLAVAHFLIRPWTAKYFANK